LPALATQRRQILRKFAFLGHYALDILSRCAYCYHEKSRLCKCVNTCTALTSSPTKEANVAADILSRPLRAALYARVSNNGQQDPEMQLRELREYASRRGWTIAAEHVEHISSAEERRPELEKLLAHANLMRLSCIATTDSPAVCLNWSTRLTSFVLWG
jgi:hypothetical protein